MKGKHTPRMGTYLLLNIAWIALTAILIIIVYYLNLRKTELETQQVLFYASDQISDRIDNFVEDLRESIYSIPGLTHSLNKCSPELKAKLQRAVYNNPMISGLVIKNSESHVLCSTLSENVKPYHTGLNTKELYGPIVFSDKHKPAFIVQQPLGSYIIDVYLLKDLLERLLQAPSPYVDKMALYSPDVKKTILEIYRDTRGKWKPREEESYLTSVFIAKPNAMLIRTKLNDLDNHEIILEANSDKITEMLQYHKIISVVIILVFSALLYYLLRRTMNRLFSMQRAIVNAEKRQQFFPEYQPIYDIKKDAFTGVEVLLRWRTSSGELIMPDAFIDEAESSGLIVPITLQMMEKAFYECQSILKKYPKFHLGFNLSAHHFVSKDFFPKFSALCKKYNISPENILLEITERELLNQDDPNVVEQMKTLNNSGFSQAVDDFGTGHASISYLNHFPFSYLKIDKLFVSAIGTGAITESLNESIIHMAQNLNLKIIAEGVESKEQFEYLKSQEVELVQGWYFAKAMSVDKLCLFLEEQMKDADRSENE